MAYICGEWFSMWEMAWICVKRLKYMENDLDVWELT